MSTTKMSKKQKVALINQLSGAKPKRKRANRPRRPRANPPPPRRNGQGRKRGGRRQRGGNRNNSGIAGVGIMRGGECVNKRTRSPPEIRDGEELIATVFGSVGFVTTQYNINPANLTTFPWLNKIAQLFERYEFEQLSFHFGHDVSGFATQGQTGLVYLSALYDAASAAPTSVVQIEATDPFVPCMPNQDSCCRLDKKSMHPSNEPKFCLVGNPPPGATDIKTYNAGSLFVTTTGMANTTEVGKLRVRYRVRLFDRILDASAANAPANFSTAFFQTVAAAAPSNGVQTVLPLATQTVNGLGIVNTAGSFVLPAGNYLLDASWNLQGIVTALQSMTIDIQKNGVSVSSPNSIAIAAASLQTAATINSMPIVVSSNGTDAFTVTVLTIYSGGAGPTYDAVFRVTAI